MAEGFGPPNDFPTTREIIDIRGHGGFLEVYRQDSPTPITQSTVRLGDKLEVENWAIRRRFYNVEIPMSGSKGAIQRRRVADDFDFIATLVWDITRLNQASPDKTAFLGSRMTDVQEAHYHVGIRFQLGDARGYPIRLANPQHLGAYYHCPSVAVDEIHIADSSVGDDVIRAVLRGSGSAPLDRYYGTDRLDSGGFNF